MRNRPAGPLLLALVGLALLQPPAAAEFSADDRRMKAHLVVISQGTEPLTGLRIEVSDGNMARWRHYEITGGQVASQAWDELGAPAQDAQWTVTDEAVRQLLSELVAQQYWVFQGTRFVPDADTFLFRFYYQGLPFVTYQCDAEEYRRSQPREAIRSTLLTFVSQ